MQVKRHFEIKKLQNHILNLDSKPRYDDLNLKYYIVFNVHIVFNAHNAYFG